MEVLYKIPLWQLLFANEANMGEIQDLRIRLDKLEAEVKKGPSLRSVESSMQPFMVDTRKTIEAAHSNITNLYTKVKALRAANKLKCSKKKCENVYNKDSQAFFLIICALIS